MTDGPDNREDQKLAQLYDAAESVEEYASGYLANMAKVLDFCN